MSYFKFIVLLTYPKLAALAMPLPIVVRGDPEYSVWGEPRIKCDNKLFYLPYAIRFGPNEYSLSR
jgi:hypothetical protein